MIRDPKWRCPRTDSGLHRWLKTEDEGRQCAYCGTPGVAVRSGVVLQPGQPDPNTRNSRRRRGVPRARTLAPKKITQADLRAIELVTPPIPEGVERPKKRGECRGGERPCPWISCRHHLYLEITPAGSIKFNFPALEPDQLAESCSLDVAEQGGHTLEEVGGLTNLTRERVRQIETRALLGPALARLRKDNAA